MTSRTDKETRQDLAWLHGGRDLMLEAMKAVVRAAEREVRTQATTRGGDDAN
jgi:hypothetical protein